MAVNTADIRGTVALDPSAIPPKDDGAKSEIAVDASGVLWSRAVVGAAPAAPGTAGAPIVWFDAPAAATAPDADTPAVVGLRNVLDSISVTINAVAAQGVLTLVVRDGATGVGTILWSVIIGPVGAGASQSYNFTGLGIVGSVNTEMTVQTTAAPAATNFCSIACTGHLSA